MLSTEFQSQKKVSIQNTVRIMVILSTLSLLILFTIFSGCSRKRSGELPEISYSIETAKMVSGVTSGLISPDSPIKVQFVAPMVKKEQTGIVLKKEIFSFSPAIAGTALWEDPRTLIFKPAQPLPMRQTFSGSLDMAALFPVYKEKNLQPLEFTFQTAGREIDKVTGDFKLENDNDPSTLFYQGTVSFTEPANPEKVEQAVSLKSGSQSLKLTWTPGAGNQSFTFSSASFKRTDAEKKFVLTIDRTPLELSADYSNEFTLAPLQELTVSNISTEGSGDSPGIRIDFSDELDPHKDINGLVRTDPALDLKLKVMGKSVYVTGPFSYGQKYTVIVSPGIRSKWGTLTRKEIKQEVEFKDIKPQMVFSNDGVFLPSSNLQTIRFKTVNLRRVRLEVKKVFDSNLGFFLQTQRLNSSSDREEDFGDWEVRRVGVTVVKDTLEISDRKNVWLQNELDLKNLISKDEKGLYLINITFQQKDMMYAGLEIDQNTRNRRYYGDDWRNDPLSPGYIYYHASISKAVVSSDIGLTYEAGDPGQVVFATNLLDAKPLGGVRISLRTYQNQDIATVVTDANGKAAFPQVDEEVFYVLAQKDNQRSVIKLNEMGWNLSTFDTEGAEATASGIRAFIFTERGVYRPGDEINLSVIVRNQNQTFPQDHPLTLKIYNPKDQLVQETTQKKAVDGFYHFSFQTRPEDLTGNWRAQIIAGTQNFYHNLRIETVVPFRLKVNIKPSKTHLSNKDRQLNLQLSSTYLFGNPAAGLDAKVEATLKSEPKVFPKYHGYTFSNQAMDYKQQTFTIFSGKLSPQGTADIAWTIPALSQAPSALVAQVKAEVFEKGGRPNTNQVSVPIDPYDAYVGLEKPDFEYGYTRVGEPVNVNTILVTPEGKPLPGQQLHYRIYRNNRHWWWEYDQRDQFHLRFKTDSNTELVEEGTLLSQSVPVSFNFSPANSGEYLVEVQNDGSNGHTAGFFFNAYYWGSAGGAAKEAGILALKSDKETYYPGETATISFPTPSTGNILVSLLHGTDVVNTRWMQPSASGNETRVEIPVTTELLPTAYVSVSVIQPHSQTLNDRPIRMYGVIPLNVEEKSTRQEILIRTAQEFQSEKPFTVDIQTADHSQTQFTIAVVDEGLLALTAFRTPDPWKHFYQKQRLGVKLFDLFGDVIGANKGDVFRTFSIGGGMTAEQYRLSQQQPERVKRFHPVDMFQGPLQTDENGHAKVQFTMPDYLGAVRIMVVSAKGKRYGHAEQTVPVKTDLMVLPSLPRILGPGDRFILPVTVFAMKDGIGKVTVSVKTGGPVNVVGESQQTVEFSKPGEQDVSFSMEAKDAMGAASIIIDARSANYATSSKTDIAVRPSSPRIYESQSRETAPGETVSLTIPKRGIDGSNHAVISVMRRSKLNLTNRLYWLIHYPYGCIEQTTSSVFPQLYLKEFIEKNGKDERAIDKNINAAIQRLQKFQLPDGGFSFWPGGTGVSVWGTNYAGHFLVSAKKLGYNIPGLLFDNWIRFEASRARTTKDNLMERVYRVYLLALAGQPQMGAMNLLKEESLKDMNDAEKWLLAAAYQLAGVENTASRIAGAAGFTVGNYDEFNSTFGTALRDQAIILEMLTVFKRWDEAGRLYDKITAQIAQDTWYSTQTLGYALMALGKYIRGESGEFGSGNPAMTGYFQLPDGKKVPFETTGLKASYEILSNFGQPVQVYIDPKTTLKRLFVVMDWDGIPLHPDVKAVSQNLTLSVEWLDEDGMSIDPTTITQGTAFWGHFTAGRFADNILDLKDLALTQIFPAGWEIENLRLSGEDLPEWMRKWQLNRESYTDIRDDRIMWFFDLPRRTKSLDFVVKLNAVTPGKFERAPSLFEAMYNDQYKAIKPGGEVTVEVR